MLVTLLLRRRHLRCQDFLNNYMSINVLDEIARLRGVGQVTRCFGGSRLRHAHLDQTRPARAAWDSRCPTSSTPCSSRTCSTPAGKLGGPRRAAPGTEFAYAVQHARSPGDRRKSSAQVVDALEPGRLAGAASRMSRASSSAAERYDADRTVQRQSRLPCLPSTSCLTPTASSSPVASVKAVMDRAGAATSPGTSSTSSRSIPPNSIIEPGIREIVDHAVPWPWRW